MQLNNIYFVIKNLCVVSHGISEAAILTRVNARVISWHNTDNCFVVVLL